MSLGLALAALAALAALPAAAAADPSAVFVQNDGLAGNQVVAYDRASDGSLTQAGVYDTGGLGGQLEGSVVDHLASQGALAYDRADGLLLATNAGSGTISVFGVFGDRLALRQVLPSGGGFPASIAVEQGLVYVLDATEGGTLAGFRVIGGRLVPLPGSERALGLDASATPQFTHTPGQVGFAPGGAQLLVTTKANTNALEVFAVRPDGRLSHAPRVDALPETVPFAFAFAPDGELLLTEAGPNAVASFTLGDDGSLTQLDAVPTNQAATCWITTIGGRVYVSNAGSGSLSGFATAVGGQLLVPLGNTHTDAGTVDSAATPGGRFLYVQAGAAGNVDVYAALAGGALEARGSVTVPGAVGGEGIVAP